MEALQEGYSRTVFFEGAVCEGDGLKVPRTKDAAGRPGGVQTSSAYGRV